MTVRWLRQALANLDQVAAYVADDNPRAAAATILRIREAVEKLVAHPAMGRPGRVPGTRELVVSGTPFIVPYRNA
ncbi:MAG TPA: type II toxin-antitoxin system RelE/ParE family toxin [Chloroflexota bacterium]|nr:type II toxin-antitoxin system RelE/ParE family toxin [Chloroflexota bacterium]